MRRIRSALPGVRAAVGAENACKVYACDAYEAALVASSAQGIWLMNANETSGGGTPIPAVRSVGTLVGNGSMPSGRAGILPNPCSTEYAYGGGAGGGAGIVGTGHTYTNIWSWTLASLVRTNSGGDFTALQCVYNSNNTIQVSIQYRTDGLIDILWQTSDLGAVRYESVARPANGVEHAIAYSQDYEFGIWSLYIDWVEVDSGALPSAALTGTPTEEIQGLLGSGVIGTTRLVLRRQPR
jgi:hypothetical protein